MPKPAASPLLPTYPRPPTSLAPSLLPRIYISSHPIPRPRQQSSRILWIDRKQGRRIRHRLHSQATTPHTNSLDKLLPLHPPCQIQPATSSNDIDPIKSNRIINPARAGPINTAFIIDSSSTDAAGISVREPGRQELAF